MASLVLGLLITVTLIVPGFTPASLISALGVGGVAISFAFKDIFQNFLAGIGPCGGAASRGKSSP